MSRCFAFPPPGYEPRPRSERKDLLGKEKSREKKHKKEKKDRGKGERKEKERDRRKDKHNKTHKKERHRERRKNKDKVNSKIQTLEQEIRKNDHLGNRRPDDSSGHNEAAKDFEPPDELANQFVCQEVHTNHKGSNSGELLHPNTERLCARGTKEKERNSLHGIKESARSTQQNHGVVKKSDSISHAKEKGMGRGVGSKTRIMKNGKSHQAGSAGKQSSRRQSSNGVGVSHDTSTTVGAGAGIDPRGRRMPQKVNQSARNFHGKMDQKLVQCKDASETPKNHHHRVVGGKHRDEHGEEVKNKDKIKNKKIENNGKANEQKYEHLGTLGASKSKDDLMNLPCVMENFASDDSKKRKDLHSNNSIHEPNMRAMKLQRTCMNGDISSHAQGTAPYSSTELVEANTSEVDRHWLQDSKECYNSGTIHSNYLEEPKDSVSSSDYDNDIGCLKSPHPDTKYLTQVHSLPSTDDFSECIDQAWLFSEDHGEQKTVMSEAAKLPKVWAETQRIDSADVVALPYVVPL
ncbi:hypothetical protein ACP4OV_005424 [Aristida adscensionis]